MTASFSIDESHKFLSTNTVTVGTDDDDSGDSSRCCDSVVYEALQVEYEEMAPWYDAFWSSYLDQTLQKPLRLVLDLEEAHEKNKNKDGGNEREFCMLDVACGTGELLCRLRNHWEKTSTEQRRQQENSENSNSNKSYWMGGVEPSLAMLHQARTKLLSSSLHSNNNNNNENNIRDQVTFIHLFQAPAEALPVANESCHVVCSTNALHFFRDKPRAVQEMFRVLKQQRQCSSSSSSSSLLFSNNTKLIVTDWCRDYWMVRVYYWFERIRWWKFPHEYPAPLTRQQLYDLIQQAGFVDVVVERYTVRFGWAGILIWGMQTATASKPCNSNI